MSVMIWGMREVEVQQQPILKEGKRFVTLEREDVRLVLSTVRLNLMESI